jgi:alpha-glucosidase
VNDCAEAKRPWWADAVIYHVYLRSFQDSNGDGVGDLRGLRARLPYLIQLGVDAVLLSPFYRSPMVDFGYDVADHTEVDPVYGTLTDFDELVADAHAYGIRILVDFIANHTSDQHPWFAESRSSRTSPRRNWYVWRDGREPDSPPNNWISVFGGPAWTFDQVSGQYYLHSFLPQHPNLNLRNPEVETAVLAVARFWLARGIDGFRVDACDHLFNDPQLTDNPPAPATSLSDGRPPTHYRSQRHINDRGHPDNHGFLRNLRRLIDADPRVSRVLLAEVITRLDAERLPHWATFFGTQLDEAHLPLNLSLPTLAWSADTYGDMIATVEDAVPAGGWPTIIFGSHDETRLASRHGRAAGRCALVLLLTLRGTPILYYGDELLLPDSSVCLEDALDPMAAVDPARNRDLGRGPMPWDGAPHAGFTDGTSGPWLPAATEAGVLTVERQFADPDSSLNLCRTLIALRRRHTALRRGSYRRLPVGDRDILAFQREHEGVTLVTVVNFGTAAVELDRFASSAVLVATSSPTAVSDTGLALPGCAAVVLRPPSVKEAM